MAVVAETIRSIAAAVTLVAHDRTALSRFNLTTAGFWHSFVAFALVAPLYLFSSRSALVRGLEDTPPDTMVFDLASLGLQWALWLLIMVPVCARLAVGQHYGRYVIVYNWLNAVMMAFIIVPMGLYQFGMIGQSAAVLLTFVLQMLALYYEWYATRLTLETPPLVTSAIVLADYVFSLGFVRFFG